MHYFIDTSLCHSLDWDYNDKVESLLKSLHEDGDYVFLVGSKPPFELSSYPHLVFNSHNDIQIKTMCFETGLPERSCVYVTNKSLYKDSGHIKTIYMKKLF